MARTAWCILRIARLDEASTRTSTLKFVEASDSSLLVVLGDAISEEVQERVLSLFHALAEHRDARIRNLHPAYASVLIDFDPRESSHEELAGLVEKSARERRREKDRAPNIVTIPVCYDAEFAPDLLEVAKHAKKSPEEVIRLHSSATYRVAYLGFSPGFAYLIGLPEALRVPRLDTPRKNVKAGTVAIAGSQAAIYPVDSPGGWKLIGRTPLRMFDPAAIPPARLAPGDVVKFQPIDRSKSDAMFDAMARR
jgi:KipI family sensor histidine kinase inhibitor